MIRATFSQGKQGYVGFKVSGHAGYAAAGSDIVCAAVSSAVQMACNAVTDVVNARAKVQVRGDQISLRLLQTDSTAAQYFLQALAAHLTLIAGDYPDCLVVAYSQQEVE